MIGDYAEQVQHEATRLRQLGFAICRILHGEKKPSYQRWTCASLEPADFLTFPGANLGIMGGTLSRDLIIVDGDMPKVRAVLRERLPRTAIDGRDSTGPGHWYFRVTEIPTWAIAEPHVAGGLRGPRIRHFKDSQKNPIGLDWIGTGGQVVVPPSLHSSGERRRWFVDIEEIITLPFKDLWETVRAVARDFGAVNVDCHGNATRDDKIIERAIKYLSKCAPAISGQSGHDTALAAARAIAWGFDLWCCRRIRTTHHPLQPTLRAALVGSRAATQVSRRRHNPLRQAARLAARR
ncbi:MAG: bifunctional DNA primase/polymerase [Gemmataceae bacterium]|nr:bifunctional DNA primase/polymerase [Gemmataceae bacterium]